MPNYDFKCNQCGHKFSRMVSIEERKNVKCPQCSSEQTSQLFTGFSVIGGASKSSAGSSCPGGG